MIRGITPPSQPPGLGIFTFTVDFKNKNIACVPELPAAVGDDLCNLLLQAVTIWPGPYVPLIVVILLKHSFDQVIDCQRAVLIVQKFGDMICPVHARSKPE